ncbi:AGC/PKG protein kinase [Phytophthora nicotianae P10297]|uniref:cGMP-dependent protein kinase n=1 Tax=Phytophthora nicotianae P10297 TaxID=1317064 RepID=W2YTH4_PHYNI|nr:AGC/PKG protein kinase [Phytophthora nicotianae P10297]
MGAAASASPRENESDMTPRTAGDLALFGAIQREFAKQLMLLETPTPQGRPTPAIGRGLHRRASDPHRKKREVVYSKGLDMTRDVLPKRQSESKTPECAAMLKKALQCVLFTDSSDEEMDRLLFLMKRIKVEAEQNVIKQGDLGDQFYVVHSGSLEVIVNTAVLGYLKPGDHFGELALIYDAPRAATVRAATNSILWTLDRDEFRMMQARSSSDSLVKRAKWLRQVEILASLSERQLALLAGVLNAVIYSDGEMIIKQGDVGDTFFIVEEGNVSCQMEGPRGFKNSDAMRTELAILGPGDYFGEMALLSDMPRNASIYAKGSVKCLSLGRQEFDSILGPLTDVLDRNSRIRILRTIPAFATKSQEALEYAVSQLEIKAYQDSQCIFRQGDIAVAFYIVKSGCVKLIKKRQDGNNNLVTEEVLLKANDTFGGEVFEQADTYTCTVISAGRSQCQRLKVSSLARSGSRQFTQRVNMGEHGRMKSCTLALDDIQVAGVLGEGSFGKVVMVHALVDGAEEQPMALKIMAKSHIIESDQQVQVMREKQVLMTIPKHPFIVDLYATYQDANNLYMLMELVQGGELFTLLHNEEFIETVDESSVRFYSANALLGLQHMHRYDYAYRDLKPENLLISREGYLKFVDFGFAKKIPFTVINSDGNEEVHSRTFTLCGTLEYLAPEFVLNTGHDIAVDYWALGILIYEMLVGYTPFGTGDGDTTQLFRNIAMIRTGANSVDFPFHLQENCPHACDLVRRLLQGDPTKRIGVGINGDQELRQHPWFSRIEWDKLYSMSLEPPYLPPLSGKYDISLFEGEIGNRARDRAFDGQGDEYFVGF